MSDVLIFSLALVFLLLSPISLLIFDDAGRRLRRMMMSYGRAYHGLTPKLLDPFQIGSPRIHAAAGSGIIWLIPSIALLLAFALPDTEANFQLTIWSIAF